MDVESAVRRLTFREQEELESQVTFPSRPGSGVVGKGIRLIPTSSRYASSFPSPPLDTNSLSLASIIRRSLLLVQEKSFTTTLKSSLRSSPQKFVRTSSMMLFGCRTDLGGIDIVYDWPQECLHSTSSLPKDVYALEIVSGTGGGRSEEVEDRNQKTHQNHRACQESSLFNLKRVEVVNLANLQQFLEG